VSLPPWDKSTSVLSDATLRRIQRPKYLSVASLPPVRVTDTPTHDWLNETGRAANVLGMCYSEHFNLLKSWRTLSLSLDYLNEVTFTDPGGKQREGFGAVVGPTGRPPVVAILFSTDDDPVIIVCKSPREWIEKFADGQPPRPTPIDLLDDGW